MFGGSGCSRKQRIGFRLQDFRGTQELMLAKARKGLPMVFKCLGVSSSPPRQSSWWSPTASGCTHTPVLQRNALFLHSDRDKALKDAAFQTSSSCSVCVSVTFAAHFIAAVAAVVHAVAGLVQRHTFVVCTGEAAVCRRNIRRSPAERVQTRQTTTRRLF